ncbi:MAG: hypothetical protein GX639_00620 [Fibrobacter sp.]|nr:hypothetical protein [Fibrobacter sp.]
MGGNKNSSEWINLNNKEPSKTSYFFLEHVCKARIDLHIESGRHGCDQEINVYLAGLLTSLIASTTFIQHKPYISVFDHDIRNYLEAHPGLRNEFVVYRDNADFSLVSAGLFSGDNHRGSYHHIVISDKIDFGKIAIYYSMAASALTQLQGTQHSLVSVLDSMSKYLEEIYQILRYAAVTYFDMVEKISDASLYHLEMELAEEGKKILYREKVDEYLKLYSDYKAAPTEQLKIEINNVTRELKNMNDQFKGECLE